MRWKNLHKKWWFWLIVVLIISYLLFTFKSTRTYENYIRGQIEKANYCEKKEECVNAGSKCPFGCYIYVNKNEVDRIKYLIVSYPMECLYDCMMCRDAECKDNKCEAVCS